MSEMQIVGSQQQQQNPNETIIQNPAGGTIIIQQPKLRKNLS